MHATDTILFRSLCLDDEKARVKYQPHLISGLVEKVEQTNKQTNKQTYYLHIIV